MTIEAYWYQDYDEQGRPPKCRRLSRLPRDVAWRAAIDLAIAFADGRAGYRSTGRNTITGEMTWLWPDFQPPRRSAKAVESAWWMIPARVERRALGLYDAATRCELCRGGGRAHNSAIVSRLRRWRKSGQWQKIVGRSQRAAAPKEAPKKKRGRPRKKVAR